VAALARNRFVCPLQRKFRQQVVIERPGGPVHRIVADCTVVAETIFVWVIFRMALDAIFGCVAEYVSFMTVRTLDLGVCSQERKRGLVEKYVVLPRCLVVAVLTGNALLTFMRVVFSVAIVTAGLQLNVENRFYVAGFTRYFLVGPVQRVIGITGVIEMNLGPISNAVAGITFSTEMPTMLVVFFVTADAGIFQAIRKRIIRMTVIAGQLGVPAT
jgi:hypothetical protein